MNTVKWVEQDSHWLKNSGDLVVDKKLEESATVEDLLSTTIFRIK